MASLADKVAVEEGAPEEFGILGTPFREVDATGARVFFIDLDGSFKISVRDCPKLERFLDLPICVFHWGWIMYAAPANSQASTGKALSGQRRGGQLQLTGHIWTPRWSARECMVCVARGGRRRSTAVVCSALREHRDVMCNRP